MRALIALVTLAVILIGACADDSSLYRVIYVRNSTSQELYAARVDEAGETRILGPSMLPGGEQAFPVRDSDTFLFRGGCTIRDLLAVDKQLHEVARRKTPLCVGQLWVVEEPAPSGS
jgi:hypothetical protein